MVEIKKYPEVVTPLDSRCFCCFQNFPPQEQCFLGNVFDLIFKCFSIKVPTGIPDTVCPSCYEQLMESQDFKGLILESFSELHVLNDNRVEEKSTITDDDRKRKDDPMLIETENAYVVGDVTQPKDCPLNKCSVDILNLNYFNLTAIGGSTDKLTYHLKRQDILSMRSKETEYFRSALDTTRLIKLQCSQCPKAFHTKNDFERHLDTHGDALHRKRNSHSGRAKTNDKSKLQKIYHNDIQSFECNICHKSFKIRSHLKIHMMTHGLVKIGVFKCDICPKEFKWKYLLRLHMVSHCDVRKFVCDLCSKSFKSRNSLLKHIIKHSKEKRYECKICSKIFASNSLLRHHMISHKEVKKIECAICSKVFKKRYTLKIHTLTHKLVPSFKCQICSSDHKCNADLTLHMMSHSNVRKFICDLCSKAFESRSKIRIHMASHLEVRMFKCDVCSKGFKTKNTLRIHLHSHFGVRSFKCNICPKTFRTNSHLKAHITTHFNVRSFECNICSKAFKTNPSLKRHMGCHVNM